MLYSLFPLSDHSFINPISSVVSIIQLKLENDDLPITIYSKHLFLVLYLWQLILLPIPSLKLSVGFVMSYYIISLPTFWLFLPWFCFFLLLLNISIPQSSALILPSHYTFIPQWSHPFTWFNYWLYFYLQSLCESWIPLGQVCWRGCLAFQTHLTLTQTMSVTVLTNFT